MRQKNKTLKLFLLNLFKEIGIIFLKRIQRESLFFNILFHCQPITNRQTNETFFSFMDALFKFHRYFFRNKYT